MPFSLDPVELYQLGFGDWMCPVAPPDGVISPRAKDKLPRKDMGKCPAVFKPDGFVPVDCNTIRCPDLATATLWRDGWGANAGFVARAGLLWWDNDQGEEFSNLIRAGIEACGVVPLRRYVLHPKHKRDAYCVIVRDFVGAPAELANENLKFVRGVVTTQVQVLAHGKQAVVFGMHPGTRSPYVWDWRPGGPEQIPQISDDQAEEITRKFVEGANSLGWALEKPRRHGVVSASATPRTAPSAPSNHALLEEILFILSILPNVDKPHAEKNALDFYLDDYDHFILIGYAIFGALGDTPEAETAWIAWAYGRVQGQKPEAIWQSIVRSSPRAGLLHLAGLAHQFAPRAWTDWLIGQAPDPPPIFMRSLWEDIRERWAFATTHDQFIDLATCEFVSRQAFNSIHKGMVEPLWIEKHGKRIEPNRAGKRVYPTMSVFFEGQADRCIVWDICYAPGDPPLTLLKPKHLYLSVNRWRPAEPPQLVNVQAAEIAVWLDHIALMLGSDEERDRFLRWSAYVLRCPREKPNWHWLVISPQGGGKDTTIEPLVSAIGGTANCALNVSVKDLISDFNEFTAKKLIVIPEIRQANSRAVENRLKPLLAAPPPVHEVNPKYGRKYEVANRNAVVMFSNEENPLHLEEDQRRVHVVNRYSAKPQPPAYYEGVVRWFEQGGLAKCVAYLWEYPLPADIEAEMKGRAPDTDAKKELEALNRDPLASEIDELIADARGGQGAFASLLATAGDILAAIGGSVGWRPSKQMVGRYLLQLEHKGTGVRRVRVDKENLIRAGVVSYKGESARLWFLGPQAPDGTEWKDWTDLQLIAVWKGQPKPQSAKIITLKSNLPPPEIV